MADHVRVRSGILNGLFLAQTQVQNSAGIGVNQDGVRYSTYVTL